MDLDQRRDWLKKLIEAENNDLSVDEIDTTKPNERVLGIEPADGELFFLVIQNP